jgi:hypothetical protein
MSPAAVHVTERVMRVPLGICTATRRRKGAHQPEACNRKKMARPSKTAKRG